MNRRISALALLAAILVPVAIYLPTLRFGFLFDDRPLIVDNPIVQAPRGLGELFTTDLDANARTSEAPATNYLRPLFIAGAAVLHRFFGAAPLGWHATAIVLHGLLSGLAFLLLRREGFGNATAFAAALLFAMHPAHAQSAAWVSGLQDLLFGVTALAAFLAYRQSRRRPEAGWPSLLLLAGAFALALLAKEPAIGLLLFVGAETIGWIPAGAGDATARRPRAELLLLMAVALVYFFYRWSVLGELAHPFPTAPAMPEALASIPVAVLAYVRDLLWPVGLFLLHPARPVSAVLSRESLFAASGLLVLAGLAVAGLRRRPELARPVGWAVAWLAPALALWAVNPEWMVMDRYLLLPGLGLAWGLALLLPLEQGRPALRAAVWLACLAISTGLSWQAMQPFASEASFWRRATLADPASSTAWAEAGRLRAEAGDLDAAADAFERAVELDPRAQLPRLRQALLALRRGEVATATAGLADLVERNPGYLPAWRNLVVAQARSGDVAAAQATLSDALVRFPEDPLLWTQRGILLRQAGRRDDALTAIHRAATLAPLDPAAALREASLLAELGRAAEAAAAARRGLDLAPAPEIRAQLEALAR
ncbi:MAG: tetratricopeptide repeat protein [Thermoanaerobaculia bacterium]